MLLGELLVNVMANVISAIVIALVAYAVVTLAMRRRVFRFFGFQPGQTKQKIYLSSIAVRPKGTIGTTDVVTGFYGAAITEAEYRHALMLSAAIQARPVFRLLQAVQGAAAGGASIADPVRSGIELCPSYRQVGEPVDLAKHDELRRNLEDAFRFASVVLIGAPIYNSMTYYAMSGAGALTSRFLYVRESGVPGPDGVEPEPVRGFRVRKAGEAEDFVRSSAPDGSSVEYLIVEKIKFRPKLVGAAARRATPSEVVVFVCCGTSTGATSAAVDILRNWSALERVYRLDEFGVVYRLDLPPDGDREQEQPSTRCRLVYSDPPVVG